MSSVSEASGSYQRPKAARIRLSFAFSAQKSSRKGGTANQPLRHVSYRKQKQLKNQGRNVPVQLFFAASFLPTTPFSTASAISLYVSHRPSSEFGTRRTQQTVASLDPPSTATLAPISARDSFRVESRVTRRKQKTRYASTRDTSHRAFPGVTPSELRSFSAASRYSSYASHRSSGEAGAADGRRLPARVKGLI